MIPMVDLKKELDYLEPQIIDAVKDVIQSGQYILGEKGAKLEKEISNYVEASYGVGVNSGTDALYLSLKALSIGPGDEVITSPFTFFATGEVIAKTGAKPVFADIEPDSYNLDPDKVEAVITPDTKAIIVVHLFGRAANMDKILDLRDRYHLYVIEDACQAIGTEFNGKRVGSFGDIGCFSFFPSKNLGAFGDAGMMVTNEQDIAEQLKRLRNHGSSRKYIHTETGINSRLDEIQAAILLTKLQYLEIFLHQRKEIARRYTEQLPANIQTPVIAEDRSHTYHQYCIETKDREQLSTFLKEKGISTAIYYPVPLHLQPAFKYLNYKPGDFPVSEHKSKTILALPIYPFMAISDQAYIMSKIKEFFKKEE
ncbi:MAG: DegT/DnrJ/EryC1/StrS family aminotransferase [Bacillaceae bacterium]|nr:DegT/DnrJ/EryC1/StrS family aminotransferase [Bacillaceae bacterium]